MVISINNAEYKRDYIIHLKFSDGFERDVDFSDFLQKARNPMTKKYLDKELFKSFTLNYGDLIWNDYEMCFPTWDLYEDKI
jgi:hypothetical protein